MALSRQSLWAEFELRLCFILWMHKFGFRVKLSHRSKVPNSPQRQKSWTKNAIKPRATARNSQIESGLCRNLAHNILPSNYICMASNSALKIFISFPMALRHFSFRVRTWGTEAMNILTFVSCVGKATKPKKMRGKICELEKNLWKKFVSSKRNFQLRLWVAGCRVLLRFNNFIAFLGTYLLCAPILDMRPHYSITVLETVILI